MARKRQCVHKVSGLLSTLAFFPCMHVSHTEKFKSFYVQLLNNLTKYILNNTQSCCCPFISSAISCGNIKRILTFQCEHVRGKNAISSGSFSTLCSVQVINLILMAQKSMKCTANPSLRYGLKLRTLSDLKQNVSSLTMSVLNHTLLEKVKDTFQFRGPLVSKKYGRKKLIMQQKPKNVLKQT